MCPDVRDAFSAFVEVKEHFQRSVELQIPRYAPKDKKERFVVKREPLPRGRVQGSTTALSFSDRPVLTTNLSFLSFGA
jgi:hypothetical protein